MRKYYPIGKEASLQIEIGLLNCAGIGLNLATSDQEDNITLKFGAKKWVWVGLHHAWIKRLFARIPNFSDNLTPQRQDCYGLGGREIGIALWTDHIALNLGNYYHDCGKGRYSLWFWDKLFGMIELTKKTCRNKWIEKMSLPEGEYRLYCSLELKQYKRPRLPKIFIKNIWVMDFKPETPIPIPGKGESSYDLDEDAIFTSTMPVALNDDDIPDIEATFQRFYQHIIDRREKYGGKDWMPNGN